MWWHFLNFRRMLQKLGTFAAPGGGRAAAGGTRGNDLAWKEARGGHRQTHQHAQFQHPHIRLCQRHSVKYYQKITQITDINAFTQFMHFYCVKLWARKSGRVIFLTNLMSSRKLFLHIQALGNSTIDIK